MENHRRTLTSNILFLITVLSLLFLNCLETEGAVFSIRPSITIMEEYDDNIFLTKENKENDFITRVNPSVAINYKIPRWDLTLDYTFLWWYYAKLDQARNSQFANLNSKMNIISNFLYLDITDRYESVVLDPRLHYTETNLDVNRSDVNTLTASPYIKYPFTPALTLSTGYRYTNIWYRRGDGISRQSHTAFASLERQFSTSLTGSINAEYTADRPEKREPDNDQTAAFVRIVYTLNPRTSIDASGGYRSIDFEGGDTKVRPLYNVLLSYSFSETGRLELRASSTFIPSPEFGIYESRMEQATVRYGAPVQFNGSVYYRRDSYLESLQGRTDKVFGVTGGVEFNASARLTCRITGSYERDRYEPQDQERDIFGAGASIDYRLTPKATLGAYYRYAKSTGDVITDNYADNVAGLQLRVEL